MLIIFLIYHKEFHKMNNLCVSYVRMYILYKKKKKKSVYIRTYIHTYKKKPYLSYKKKKSLFVFSRAIERSLRLGGRRG